MSHAGTIGYRDPTQRAPGLQRSNLRPADTARLRLQPARYAAIASSQPRFSFLAKASASSKSESGPVSRLIVANPHRA
jgi:hypothetical protein